MNGVFLIDKPPGMTSFDVIARLRKLLNEKRIGHTGTLDPNATGLLMILVGQSTKLVPFLSYQSKTYKATLKLGIKTNTGDIWGDVIKTCLVPTMNPEELKSVLTSFTGEIEQIPPMVSALSVNGKRLYEYARENINIERKPRPVTIYDLQGTCKDDTIELSVTCSSGTYIRTLCEDIAEALHSCGTMTSLRRISIDHLSIDQAQSLDSLSPDQITWLNPMELITYPEFKVDDPLPIFQGKALVASYQGDRLKIIHQNSLLAIYEWKSETHSYRSVRGLW